MSVCASADDLAIKEKVMSSYGGPSGPRKPLEVGAADGHRLLLTVEEAARLLSIGRPKMWRLAMAGEVVSVKIGASRRIPMTALEAYVRRLMIGASGAHAHAMSPQEENYESSRQERGFDL